MRAGDAATWREARQAPDVVARRLDGDAALVAGLAARLRNLGPRFAVTSARGGSDDAAADLRHLADARLGPPVFPLPPSLGRGGKVDRSVRTGVPVFAIR